MFSRHFYRTLEKLGIPEHMLNRANIGFKEKWKPLKILFEQQTIPKKGWNEDQITMLLKILNNFDSDKDP